MITIMTSPSFLPSGNFSLLFPTALPLYVYTAFYPLSLKMYREWRVRLQPREQWEVTFPDLKVMCKWRFKESPGAEAGNVILTLPQDKLPTFCLPLFFHL